MKKTILLALLVLMGVGFVNAQSRVTGKVTSAENGSPLPFVTVAVKGTNVVAYTEDDGTYTIDVPSNNGTLIFSFVSMQTQEVNVGNRSVINVVMEADAQLLDDVIVVAFGTAKKEAFTGSAAVITSEELSKRVSTNVLNSLAGQLPGVQIRMADGAPGQSGTIRIRGFTSLYAGNDPLIIVDGAPYEGSLSTINQADIETFTVLKDAAANALYGARAANGVIMITTKRARKGEAVVTLDTKIGWKNDNVVEYDVIRDPGQHYETYFGGIYNYFRYGLGQDAATAHTNALNRMMTNLGEYNVYETNGQDLIVNGKLNPNATLGRVVSYNGQDYYLRPDDWKEAAYQTGLRQEYNVNISGGNEQMSLYASFGYLNEEGTVIKSGYERFTSRLKADYQAKSWLNVGGNISYYKYNQVNPGNYDSGSGSSGNIFTFTSRIAPIFPLYIRDGEGNIRYDDNGNIMYDYGNGDNAGLRRMFLPGTNAISDVQLNDRRYNGSNFNIYGYADINFTRKLKLHVNATSYTSEYRYSNFTNPYYGQYAGNGGIIAKQHSRANNLNLQQILTYSESIDLHSFDVMVAHEYYNSKSAALYGSRDNMFSSTVHELDHAINVVNATSSSSRYNTEGYLGRVQYNYDNKYFASASFRRDATSRFKKENRWGNFWSIGGAWLINKESFMSSVSWVDMLKFKISYGSNGNDQIGNYRYTDLYEIVNANGIPGVSFTTRGNPEITWETNSNFNTGFEFELLNRRLSGSIEYYNRKTYDLLFLRPSPESSGYSSYYDNIGDMKNEGFELNLTGVIFNERDLRLTANFNIATLHNEITKLPPERTRQQNGFPSSDKWISEGGSIYDYYLAKFAGVNENGLSMWYKKVLDADGNHIDNTTTTIYAEASQYNDVGSAIPKASGGFGLNFYYKGFDLSLGFDYQLGGKVYDGVYASLMSSPTISGDGTVIHKDILSAWSPSNTSSGIPRYYFNESVSQVSSSDRFLISATYLNFQNVNLGYNLPSSLIDKMGVQSVRIYCSVENIYYWSRRKGLDPRQAYDGSTRNTNYGGSRAITVGAQLTF